MLEKFCRKFQQLAALVLACLLGAGSTWAGVLMRESQGVVMTGLDGIRYEVSSGVVMTGVDRLLGFNVNNISWADMNGVPLTSSDGVVMTGLDGATFTGTDSFRATRADSVSMTSADGVVMTGLDGVVMTGLDGTRYEANSVLIRQPSGVVMTGVDGVVMTGLDGLRRSGADGVVMSGVDGVVMTGVDEFRETSATQITATRADGTVFNVPPDGVVMTGIDQLTLTGSNGVVMTGLDGVVMTGLDGIPRTGLDGVVMTGLDTVQSTIGIQGLDPDLAKQLDAATDDSNINAVVVYHRPVTSADISELERIGITGGTRFHMLPMVVISGQPEQIETISELPTVRSMWSNRTLQWTATDNSRELTGTTRVSTDADLTQRNNGTTLSGRGIGVAVLDTGLDSTHADIAGRVLRNVKLADLQGTSLVGFNYPKAIEGLTNTDQSSGHGTFVGGVIAGSGARSNGKYTGVATGARLVGLSAGDLNLFYVLAGFDYLLQNKQILGVRVVNCSFSANTTYMEHDPVNVATKILADNNINVVFSAGNTGPGLGTLNPYAVVPWVVSVGATDGVSHLADFSSRGVFASQNFRPTVVAPGVNVVSLRSGASPTLVGGIAATGSFSTSEAPFYTVASGTSFSAPQVAGAIALMLEANPNLTPPEVRDILQRTATPLPAYYAHEAGAGMLNAHAAVLEAAYPARRFGMWRATNDLGQVSFIKEPVREFAGTATASTPSELTFQIPEGALLASVEIAWGPVWSTNDLGLSVYDAANRRRAYSNTLNLPGLNGRRERAVLDAPDAGAWRVRVSNSMGLLGTAQRYSGTFEVARIQYGALQDLGGVSNTSRAEIEETLRTFVMLPSGDYFRPDDAVTRSELAATLLRGAQIPQYMPAVSSFTDVPDVTTMNYVESVQAAPSGAIFHDALRGGPFRPDEQASRLTAAVALVRAAGLRATAENYNGTYPDLLDWDAIPAELRNYVAVALTHRLLYADGGAIGQDGSSFNPQSALTRAELAHAMTVVAARLAAK